MNSILCQVFPGSAENRRRHSRVGRRTLLTIQQLNDDLSQVGETIWGFSNDFSQSGIGFTCQYELAANYLRVTINEDGYAVIGVVRHRRLIDESTGTYFVGLQYLDDYNAYNG